MQREWDVRLAWQTQGEYLDKQKEIYWKELAAEEKSLVGGMLNLFDPNTEADSKEWATAHKELEQFYVYGQHEPIPHKQSNVYHHMAEWAQQNDPATWAWYPERQRLLQQGLKRRAQDLDEVLNVQEPVDDRPPQAKGKTKTELDSVPGTTSGGGPAAGREDAE